MKAARQRRGAVSRRPAPAGAPRWRLVDSGARDAAGNIALDAAMLRMRAAGIVPSTLRLLSFSRPAVLVGRFQSPSREARMEYCRRQGIEINRRLTGGGAIYLGPSQLGWELVATRRELGVDTFDELAAAACAAAVRALKLLGVEARFRPRNDIEVEGRKLCGTGGTWEGDAFLFQGTLLVDHDVEAMVRALRVPVEKLGRRRLEAMRDRVTCLRELLGRVPSRRQLAEAFARGFAEELGIALEKTPVSGAEEALAERLQPFHAGAEWRRDIDLAGGGILLGATRHGEGGSIRAAVSVDAERRVLEAAVFSGDFFSRRPRTVLELESRLKNVRLEQAVPLVLDFLAGREDEFPGLEAEDFAAALAAALAKAAYVEAGLDQESADGIEIVGGQGLGDVAARARTLLLPYCAKPLDCGYRDRGGCDCCGECSVGTAWEMARDHGLRPLSIQNYRHL